MITKIIKEKNYLTIQGFMRTKLNLKGSSLLIYAIIYGFSQIENQKFTGSLQYLCDWTGCTKQGVINSIKKLLERKLIKKEIYLKNNIKYCKYSLIVLNKVEQGIKQSLMGIKQSLPNNKAILKTITKEKKESDFLFFKKIIKKYKEPQKLRDTTIEKLYPSLKSKFEKCLKTIGDCKTLEKNIENYLDYLKVDTWRKKAEFSVFINQPEKYLSDWINEKEQALKRKSKSNLTEKEKIKQQISREMRYQNGN